MRIIFLILIVNFAIIGCRNKSEYHKNGKVYKEYYDVGARKLLGVREYDTLGSLVSTYFKNQAGEYDSIKTDYSDGVARCKTEYSFGKERVKDFFYKTGALKEHRILKRDGKIWNSVFYDELGEIERTMNYINRYGKPYINQVISFNRKGLIDLNNTKYFDVIINEDTITKDDKITFKILRLCGNDVLLSGLICDFDGEHRITDSSRIKYFDVFEETKVSPRKLHNDTLRVIIKLKRFGLDGTKDSSRSFTTSTYIEKPFFVKD